MLRNKSHISFSSENGIVNFFSPFDKRIDLLLTEHLKAESPKNIIPNSGFRNTLSLVLKSKTNLWLKTSVRSFLESTESEFAARVSLIPITEYQPEKYPFSVSFAEEKFTFAECLQEASKKMSRINVRCFMVGGYKIIDLKMHFDMTGIAFQIPFI